MSHGSRSAAACCVGAERALALTAHRYAVRTVRNPSCLLRQLVVESSKPAPPTPGLFPCFQTRRSREALSQGKPFFMELTPSSPHRGDCIAGDEENENTCEGSAVGPRRYDQLFSEVRAWAHAGRRLRRRAAQVPCRSTCAAWGAVLKGGRMHARAGAGCNYLHVWCKWGTGKGHRPPPPQRRLARR